MLWQTSSFGIVWEHGLCISLRIIIRRLLVHAHHIGVFSRTWWSKLLILIIWIASNMASSIRLILWCVKATYIWTGFARLRSWLLLPRWRSMTETLVVRRELMVHQLVVLLGWRPSIVYLHLCCLVICILFKLHLFFSKYINKKNYLNDEPLL